MIKFHLVILLILVSIGVTSCVDGGITYIEPIAVGETNNSIVLNQSKEKVWMKMINGIDDTFFVINNIEKDTGLMNVSYAGDPCQFIECGTIDSKVSNVAGKRNYKFPGCIKSKKYEEVNNGRLFNVERSLYLKGRANVIIREISERVLVKVKVRYVVTKKAQIQQGENHFPQIRSDVIYFDSNGGDGFPNGMKCYANGRFEKKILDIVKN